MTLHHPEKRTVSVPADLKAAQGFAAGLAYHSQYGEDRWIIENLALPAKGTFVEVGAGDGRTFSNSLVFESLGWTGVIVEPDPRRDLAWRKCRIERCAAASYDGTTAFGQAGCADHSGIGRSGTTIRVPCKRLDTILRGAGIASIDLLSIDTEGTELDVWRSFDPEQYKPRVVIIEFNTVGLPDKSAQVVEAVGPAYRVCHKTEANLIFERRDAGQRGEGTPGEGAHSVAVNHSPIATAPRRLVRVGRRVARVPEALAARHGGQPREMPEDTPGAAIEKSAVVHSIALIGTYFGPLPPWIDNYIETCKHNPSITWFLFVDGEFPRNRAANVRPVRLTLAGLNRLIHDRLGVAANITYGYKACDIKPMFGELFADYLRGFDFWGHCDLDLIWGALRNFLTPGRLSDFDVISSGPGGVRGALTLFRNVPFINGLYRRGAYVHVLTDPQYQVFDECGCSPIVTRAHEAGELRLLCADVHEYDGYHPGAGSGENACTWRNGRLTCTPERRELMYYHFPGTKRWSWPDIWDGRRKNA